MDRPLARLLVDSVQHEPAGHIESTWQAIPVATLVDAADDHRIAPAVYRHLQAADGVPADWLPPLHARYDRQLLRHLTTAADLAIVARTLDSAGVTWLVMKGPVLADHLWPRPDMRQYLDLDVLVRRRQFGAAIAALEDAGAELLDRNWQLINDQLRAELTLMLPHGTTLDLHWDLVNDRRTRAQLRVPTAAMLERATPVSLGPINVPTFDEPDTVLSLALHAAHSGAMRLVWLKDVHCAVTVPSLDWTLLRSRARASGLDLALHMVLAKAQRVLGGEKAPHESGRTGWWPIVAELADRRYPAPWLPGEKHTGQLAYRSVRGSSISSAAAAVRSLLRPPRAAGDGSGNPLHLDRPDGAARSSYLHAVETSARP